MYQHQPQKKTKGWGLHKSLFGCKAILQTTSSSEFDLVNDEIS